MFYFEIFELHLYYSWIIDALKFSLFRIDSKLILTQCLSVFGVCYMCAGFSDIAFELVYWGAWADVSIGFRVKSREILLQEKNPQY